MSQPHTPPDEQAFLDGYDPALFERPSVAVDVVLLAPVEGSLHSLLIQRQEHPFRLKWALPGGFIRMNEDLEAAAARVLLQARRTIPAAGRNEDLRWRQAT